MSTTMDCLDNEKPMDSALNSAHFHSRRADNHLKYGRYDDAIKNHKEVVNYLNIAISESTIPKSIEYLKLQSKHHENLQQIIQRQAMEFEDFLLRNGLKMVNRQHKIVKGNQRTFPPKITTYASADVYDFKEDFCDDDEFFSLVGELKIDQNVSVNVTKHDTINRNDDSDSEEYLSLDK